MSRIDNSKGIANVRLHCYMLLNEGFSIRCIRMIVSIKSNQIFQTNNAFWHKGLKACSFACRKKIAHSVFLKK